MASMKRKTTKIRFTPLTTMLIGLSDEHIAALYRVAKTRGRAFFTDPYNMMELREELRKRNM